MNLSRLIPNLENQFGDIQISGLSADSRRVKPGDLFFALAGEHDNGIAYVNQAITAGAKAVVHENSVCPGNWSVPAIAVHDARHVLALTSAKFYGSQPETVVAVTGTAGKSSVADFTRQIFDCLGYRSANIGTLGVVQKNTVIRGGLTTPGPIELHQTLKNLQQAGVTHCAIEASSHGIEQRRLDGVALKAAAFTNLGHDHLDYHQTRAAYFDAKLRLFRRVISDTTRVVLNADSPQADTIASIAAARGLEIVSVGLKGHDLRIESVIRQQFGQYLSLIYKGVRRDIQLPLIGEFQASNAVVAAGLALSQSESIDSVLDAIGTLRGVKGRLEKVASWRGGMIIIDYAHKPDSLAATLDALRPYVSGRLICIFGCGGDRDRAKRPMMGHIAMSKSDIVVVTDDNPRNEDPALIRSEILAGCKEANEIADRFEAIRYGIELVGEGDILVIAGKGHEEGQIIGTQTVPFSDHAAVEAITAEIGQ
jgi:UDP-N-acetylmuramoyl-L-alanyl-D-glutamate--2,6-diaminopimelate ligase